MSIPVIRKPAIRAGLILSRTPIIAPELTKLESQYYAYQSELEKRLMWTFPAYYYFKRGSLASHRFIKAQKWPVSKAPGVWYPRGVPDIRHGRERRLKQEVVLPKEKKDVTESTGSTGGSESVTDLTDASRPIVPNSRITEADKLNDLKSLERQLSRTLYLLVQDKSLGKWIFPSFDVVKDTTEEVKPLHEVAEDGLRSLVGPNINTWTVSGTPASVLKQENDVYEFLIKSHILAGNLELTKKGLEQIGEYAWLTRDEIKEHVETSYFENVEFLLAK
ncbi:hypothetical protein NCAS_0A00750 [Naumovozyma castellii]|uniref:Large ribosomal subunit protein mL46 n=1 Tax=Naumovozyma castellii TaxID=27288 RepID=G0V599_NAUCA|nr:hypothetical protein NCAS_0A00750 [Naumovozyma castellii CBS 4309]CCC66635.1 hypothetical protein NCAS_0A00750 [Naumovozyma castellii CBS 4309]